MNWIYLLENPVLRTLPRWILVMTGAVLAALASATSASLTGNVNLGTMFFAAVIWACVSFYIVGVDLRNRCSSFALSLPVSAHRLWRYHVAAVVLGVSALFTVTVATLAGGTWIVSVLSGRSGIPMDVIAEPVLPLYSVLLLVVAVVAGSGSAVQSGRRSTVEVVLTIGVVAAGFGAFAAIRRVEPALWWLPAVVAAAILTARQRRVPQVLDVAVEGVSGDAAGSRSEENEPWQPGRWFLDRTIYACMARNVRKKVSPFLTVPFLLAFGALLGGADEVFFDERLGIAYVPMAVYMLLAFTAHPLSAMPTFDTLPISRRRLFAILVLPHFLSLSVGYGIGDRMVHAMSSREPIGLAKSRETGRVCCTRVPLTAYEIAWDGEPPVIEAPWGERCDAKPVPLYKGSRVVLYTPFVTSDRSSIDFIAWQLSRATGAVFEAPIPPDDLRDRYLELDDEGRPHLKSAGVAIIGDYGARERWTSGPMMPVVMSAVFVLWMVLLGGYLRSFRATLSSRVRRIVLIAVLGVAMLLWLGWFVGAMLHWANPAVVDAFIRIVVRGWGATPLGKLLVWVSCAMACALSFVWSSRRFERMEVLQGEVPLGRS